MPGTSSQAISIDSPFPKSWSQAVSTLCTQLYESLEPPLELQLLHYSEFQIAYFKF